jgi:poly-beta-1,6-N-acetyl-D-glucosamine synthase
VSLAEVRTQENSDDLGSHSPGLKPGLTVIVPAFNEAASIADTLNSLLEQTLPPLEIIVVDDCSTDETGSIAESSGAIVLRPPENTGSKAAAQSYALRHITTTLTMAIDADTVLAHDSLEKLLPSLDDPDVAAACGFVVPRIVRSMWERGRYVEYLFAFSFLKPIQNYYKKPLISSGCFSAYRTVDLLALGGWSDRTLAEDMDLTWSFYRANKEVRFVPEAVCYPIEPSDLNFLHKQLRRWSHGFLQNVILHWRGVLHLGFLRSMLAVAVWDSLIAPLCYFLVVPMLAILVSPWYLLGYLIDAPAVLVPVVVGAIERRELPQVVSSLPAFFVLRLVNGLHMIEAAWSELIVKKRLTVYEKGH